MPHDNCHDLFYQTDINLSIFRVEIHPLLGQAWQVPTTVQMLLIQFQWYRRLIKMKSTWYTALSFVEKCTAFKIHIPYWTLEHELFIQISVVHN